MFKKLLVVVIVVASLAGLIGVASALYTSGQTGNNNVFTSGTVIFTTTDPITGTFTLGNMAPDDEVYKPITVNNVGTLELRYALISAATDADGLHLNGQLTMTIKSGITPVNCTNGVFTGGTTLYDGLAFASTVGINVIGNPAPGNQGNDQTLAPSDTQNLCLYVKLPRSTGNAFQGATTTATFTFVAEQTANNP